MAILNANSYVINTSADVIVNRYENSDDLCTLTVNAENMNTSATEVGGTVVGGGKVQKGMTVQVEATPDQWYNFSVWELDGNAFADTNPMTIVVSRDMILTVKFQEKPSSKINLSVTLENGGTVSGSGRYEMGNSVTISATPNEGYYFRSWLNSNGDTVYNKTPYTLTWQQISNYPNMEVNLTAQFLEIPSGS